MREEGPSPLSRLGVKLPGDSHRLHVGRIAACPVVQL